MIIGSIRVLYDPISAIFASTAAEAVGRRSQGFAAAQDDLEQAAFADEEALNERILRRQELDDFDKEARRFSARQNAVFAARGADLSSGDPLALAGARAGQDAEGRRRLVQQSEQREKSFQLRGSQFRRRASIRRRGGNLGALGSVAKGFQSFLRINKTQAATGG